jgi:NodT family efflux transporter outer membrane factor (OMF) lipoprotein
VGARSGAKRGIVSIFGAHSDGISAVVALAHADWLRGGWVRRKALRRERALLPTLICVLALTACTVGPDYIPLAAPTPTKFKELKGWKVATPSDSLPRGDWWSFYRDPKLALLIKQVEISNQTVASAAAAYEQARALIREAQAALFPTLNASYNATRNHTGAGVSGIGAAIESATFVPALSATWDLDVWGKVRRQIESNSSAAQASSADLDNAKLSAQAQLATAYFNLQAADSLRQLLDKTVVEFKETERITANKVNAGCCAPPLTPVTPADLALAKAQVESTQAQAINVGVQRAEFEHAIAILTGRPPAELSIGTHYLGSTIPKIPVTVPSALLERRPDIAAAERTVQEENALIGVAVAAYFPDISLSGLLSWTGSHPLPFNVANEIWSLGAAGTQVVFEGGLRGAQVDAARAAYWASVANYRQTVLTAFQQVEDQLAAIRILTKQLVFAQQAVKDAREAVRVDLNQYNAGTVDLTVVVTAEVTLLADEEAELTVRQDLYLASVSLIEALGGGWDTALVPAQKELEKDFSLLPQLPPNGSANRPPEPPAAGSTNP